MAKSSPKKKPVKPVKKANRPAKAAPKKAVKAAPKAKASAKKAKPAEKKAKVAKKVVAKKGKQLKAKVAAKPLKAKKGARPLKEKVVSKAKKGKESSKKAEEKSEKVVAPQINWSEIESKMFNLDFYIDKRSDECCEKGCDNLKTTLNYCRLHYITNWKAIQKKAEIIKDGKLQEYVKELAEKLLGKQLDGMIQDLSDDKEFFKRLDELHIRNSFIDDEVEVEDSIEEDDEEDILVETRDYLARATIDEEPE